MAGLLDDLMNAYGTAGSGIGNVLSALGSKIRGNPTATMQDALNNSSDDGSVGSMVAANQGQAPANVASAHLPNAAQIAARQGSQQMASAAAAPTSAPAQAQGGPALQAASVPDNSVAQVNANTGFPSASDYNADGTQAAPGSDAAASQPAGGLLGSLAGAASDAVNDPVKSKGLLSALGDAVSGMGDRLKNMSPAASQGLIAAGMTMLQNNDGRHNLAQLVGDGGVSGLNAYQQVNQNRILAAKNMIDMQHMQNQDQVAAQDAATKQWQATHPTLNPEQAVVNATGIGGAPVTSGVVKSYGTIDQIQPDGSTLTSQKDISGNPIAGTGVISKNPNVGPLQSDQLKVVNGASDQAAKDQAALNRTQNMLTQLQTVNIPAGLKAKGQDLWTQLTGDQTTGQVLRNQLQQQTYQNYLATWKPGIGGRLTNTDVNLLKQGMPPDTASSDTWTKFLTSYGKLQGDVADQSTRGAAFTAQNRGDQGVLHAPLTVAGMTYPSGSSYQQVVMGQGGTAAQQSGQNGGNAANSALLAEAQRRGLKQNANGQWVVSQ